MGGSSEILYCIILQKGVGGWVENMGFSNYVISECSLSGTMRALTTRGDPYAEGGECIHDHRP